ncbi:hypothetical protein Fcan01_07845 [Folsomia candida]|uniref:Uncharacterized protein n=1 Tax=Folsomia candida TaxID=158441 RepID=A0A226EH72_FOLCA|nr:hypothetical protein Fcan01_07845 [Folsomia candida]
MDRFVLRLNATPTQSTSTPATSSGMDTPPPSPAEQPLIKKTKTDEGIIVPQLKRATAVDWETRLTLNEDRELGFINSQEEFENLYAPPTPSSSSTVPTPSRKTE